MVRALTGSIPCIHSRLQPRPTLLHVYLGHQNPHLHKPRTTQRHSVSSDGLKQVSVASPAAERPCKPTQEEIAARIARSRERRAARPFIKCPACRIGVASPASMHKHMKSCCPDIMDVEAWNQMLKDIPGGPKAAAPPDFEPLTRVMSEAAEAEEAAREKVLYWTFRSGATDEQGQLRRRSVEEVAGLMSLPVPRVSRLLSSAMRAVPLVADNIPLDILHECEHFLAVNKPPGVQTAPVHRFKGGSMVNRALGYLGYQPHVLHRLDMDTSGVLLFAKKAEVVAAVHKQFRRRTVSKLYVCIGVGCPSQQQWDERGSVGPHPDVTVARLVRQEGQQQHQQPHSGPTTQASTTFQSNLEDRSLDTDSSGHHSEGDSEPVLGSSVSSPVSVVSSSSEGEDDESDVWQRAHTSFMLLDTAPDASLEGATPGEVYKGCQPGGGQHQIQQHTVGACLVAAAPHSGRTHQIRVHMEAAGHPLVGDELYGLQGPWIKRQALHAARLRIQHPITGQYITFTAPLPEDMQQAIHSLGLCCSQSAGDPGSSHTHHTGSDSTTWQGTTAAAEVLVEKGWKGLHS